MLGELDMLIPPPEAELATAVAVGLETPPEATELPVDCMDVPDVVPLILLVAVLLPVLPAVLLCFGQ